MTGQILIPLSGSDRIEQFLPYIEQVARPGMKIVFLVHYGLSGFRTLMDEVLAIQTGISVLPGINSDSELVKERIRSAERQVLPACESLLNRKVEIVVNVYAGPLRSVVGEYMQKEDVHLVMMRPGFGNPMTRALRKLGFISRFFKAPTFPPVILLHPGKQS